ncbi:MAG: AI-2E family transporter [Acidimicrobiales bacterium]|nr:AI-2E family transporter [Acidimicrobiales bacterium]
MPSDPDEPTVPHPVPPAAVAGEPVRRRVIRYSGFSLVRAVLVVGLGVFGVFAFLAAKRPLGWLLVAILLAALLYPIVERLARHLPRGLAIAVVAVGGLLLVGGITYRGIDEVRTQADRVERAAPAAARDLQRSERFGEFARQAQLEDKVATFVEELPDRLRGGDTVDALRSAASRGAAFVATFVLMLFVLISGPRFIDSGLAQIRDPERRAGVQSVLEQAYPRAWRYVALSLAKAIVAGLFTWAVCVVADVPGAVLLGLWVGAWSLVPAVGVLVGSLAVVLLGVTVSLETAAALLALFLAYQVAEVLVLQRRIEARSIHVGPFVSLVVAALGLELYGIGGLFGGLAVVVFVLCVLDGLAPTDDSDLPDAAGDAFDVA